MSSYLPQINFEDGLSRVMGNRRLYLRLLKNFEGEKMTNDIIKAIEENDNVKIIQKAHALRGAALNMGFPVVQQITTNIEEEAKESRDTSHFIAELNSAMEALQEKIEQILKDNE